MSEFHTDALRPSSLPTASLGRRQTSSANTDKDADAELDKVAEEWNLRIDKEMKNLTGGLGELVELADITPNPSTTQITSLHLKLKTSQLIRSAQSIRDIAHELKLMLLLSDQGSDVRERDREVEEVGREVEEGRKGVAGAVVGLMARQGQEVEGAGGTEGDDGMDGEGGMDVDTRDAEANLKNDEGAKVERAEDEEDEDEDEGFEQVA